MDHSPYEPVPLPVPKPSDESTTVLEPLRPNVVVRRRVVVIDAPRAGAAAGFVPEKDDEAPPSSVFLHPDYNRVTDDQDDDDGEDDEEDVVVSTRDGQSNAVGSDDRSGDASLAEAPVSIRPVVNVDADATISSVAKQLGRAPSEVAAELLAQGYYSVQPRTRLSSELIGSLAEMLHCKIAQTAAPVADRAPEAPAKATTPTKKKKPAVATKRVAAKKTASVKKRGVKGTRQR